MEKYRPVRQRTVRGETSKDKAGALPPAVYTQQHNFNKGDLMAGLANDPNTEHRVAFTREEEGEFVQATSEGGDVTEVTFVDDCLLALAVAKEIKSLSVFCLLVCYPQTPVSPRVITFRLFLPPSQSPTRNCQTEPNQINRN